MNEWETVVGVHRNARAVKNGSEAPNYIDIHHSTDFLEKVESEKDAQRVKIPLPLASFRPARSCAAREKYGKVFSLSRTPIRASLTLRGDCFRNLKLQRPKIMVRTLTSPSFRTVCVAVVQLKFFKEEENNNQ